MSIREYLVQAGFILDSGEDIYKISGIYNYGHPGVLLKKNIQQEWEKFFVFSKKNSFLLDGSILTPKSMWEASGHLKNFHDFLVDCKNCKKRFRLNCLAENENLCPECNSRDFTNEKEFNLIFKTNENYYLRPETAQLIFSNFNNIMRIFSPKLPFCISQIGKSFRNEVTVSNFIFRTKEFEQMECEWFLEPENWENCFNNCFLDMKDFLLNILGINEKSIRFIDVKPENLAHYSKKNRDIEFLFEHGWSELWGLAYRTDYDLLAHQKYTNKDFKFFDQRSGLKYIPHVVEHSIGLNRLFYALVTNCFTTENKEGKSREILKIKYNLAPYKFSILPLTKDHEELSEMILDTFLSYHVSVFFLKKGSIGKRYRKNDFLGTPYCVTVDSESFSEDNNPSFTIRDRDTTIQKRFFLKDLIKNEFKIEWLQTIFSDTSSN